MLNDTIYLFNLNSWELSINHFFDFQDHYFKCYTNFSLREVRHGGLFIYLLGLDINTFNTCKMKI